MDEIEPGRPTAGLLIVPDRTGPLGAGETDDVADLAVAADRAVVAGFLTAASDIEARGFIAPEADLREETEPEGEMTEARLGTAPDSATALPLAEEARAFRDAAEDMGAFAPAASEVRRVGAVAPAAGVRVVEGVTFDIVEVAVFFKGEEVVGVVPATLEPETVLVTAVAGYVREMAIEEEIVIQSVTSQKTP